jgi:small subunit ribosomal protein S17
MAEEEKNEQQEETQAEETPAEETPAEEAPEEDASKEVEPPAAAADEEASGDEDGGGEDGSTDGEAVEAADEAGPDPLEGLDWKTRRRLEHSRQPAEQRPEQSADQRAAGRGESRKQAAAGRSAYRAKRRGKKEAGTGTPPAERRSAGRKVRQGRVVSSKPDKTITVQIDIARRHPQYEKIVRQSRTLHAHDARNEAGEGDLVRIVETRPLSRTKRWRLVEILEKAE